MKNNNKNEQLNDNIYIFNNIRVKDMELKG